MIIMFYYKSDELMITSLIIIMIRFVRFYKRKIDKSHIRPNVKSHFGLYNHKFYNHGVIITFFFVVSYKKQLILKKSYL